MTTRVLLAAVVPASEIDSVLAAMPEDARHGIKLIADDELLALTPQGLGLRLVSLGKKLRSEFESAD